MGDIRTSALGGIPFGNNAGRPLNPTTGQPYFNGQEQRLELYANTGWENIVSETPGVVSVSGNYLESAGSGALTITGTNFTTGAVASVIGTNGVEVNASSTTVNSIVSVTAVFSGLSNANEPYDVKITNTSNLFGLLPDCLYINANPIWQTASGSLGSFIEQVSISVSATATDDSTITYSLASGSTLPSGVTLNSSTGLISGTLPDIATTTTYTFTINASDGSNPAIPRTFSITSNAFVAEYLVVGGGGQGGSRFGGGGGAGGLRLGNLGLVLGSSYLVSVGTGGSTGSPNNVGANGSNSTFANIVSAGGGGGASENLSASSGGSGGGGSYGSNAAGSGNTPSVSPSQGFSGGIGQGSVRLNGGGGGAGSAGSGSGNRGNGGDGVTSSITGAEIVYAGGGGAADNRTDGGGQGTGSHPWGLGGSGGGGAGGGTEGTGTGDSRSGVGVSGTNGLGGGGGGGAYIGAGAINSLGGFGGSGVVVIAYSNALPALSNIPGTLTYDQPTRSGYRVYRFTAGSGTVTV